MTDYEFGQWLWKMHMPRKQIREAIIAMKPPLPNVVIGYLNECRYAEYKAIADARMLKKKGMD